MNLFFELADCIVNDRKYFAVYDARPLPGTKLPPRYHGMAANSDRIWCEEEHEVYYIKNRNWNVKLAVVDMKEFLLVKLKSQAV